MPAVSVVVPVRGSAQELVPCLHALSGQRGVDGGVEVVVVDNGSQPPLPEDELKEAGAHRVLRCARPGSYAARNDGARAARAPYLAFTDADCRPDAQWLQRLLEHLEGDHCCDAVAGAVELTFRGGRPTGPAARYEAAFSFDQRRNVQEHGFAVTANLALRADVWHGLGGFREAAGSGGDVELGRRLFAAGLRLCYEPGAVVRHPARETLSEIVHKADRTARGVAVLGSEGLLPVAGRRRHLRRQAQLLWQARSAVAAAHHQDGLRAATELALAVTSVRAVTAYAGTAARSGRRRAPAEPRPPRAEGVGSS